MRRKAPPKSDSSSGDPRSEDDAGALSDSASSDDDFDFPLAGDYVSDSDEEPDQYSPPLVGFQRGFTVLPKFLNYETELPSQTMKVPDLRIFTLSAFLVS
jgi:hypothetical protein